MPTSYHLQRLGKLRALLPGQGLSFLLVTHLPNIQYLTGFTGSNGLLLLTREGARLLTDGRYRTQARQEVRGAQVGIVSGSLLSGAAAHLRAIRRGRVGIEADYLTVSQRALLESGIGPRRLVSTSGLTEQFRAVKDVAEQARIRKAAQLISRVFETLLSLIRPGISERDLAARAEFEMRRLGATGPSFETIVASGPRTALPHARPTARKLGRNELVLLDMGAILDGYCSDLTRTVFIGKAGAKVQDLYRAVQQAQVAACRAVRPGAGAGEIDRIARGSLAVAGFDRYFAHSTGHGIGLEIHEAPRLAKGQETKLVAGNVITIEPGVYIEGLGGIRIEDDVLVTPGGSEILTQAHRDFLQL
jgi:Xaa-Pro aminopeptidase